MKQIEIFYLTGCPYCRMAEKAVRELTAENAAYASVPVRWIEENEESELAAARDYYRVPSVYLEGAKLYEASPEHGYDTIRAQIRRAFEAALA